MAKGTLAGRVPPRFFRDPVYGDIPLVEVSAPGLQGKVQKWWDYDPDYNPPLPRGAVRGNVRNQSFCSACHVPKYFYVDDERRCLQCGETFTFRAKEQKYWYESLKFHFSSVPVRCLRCRRLRRSEHALREQIAVARAHVRESGTDPAAHLALARALIEYHLRTEEGDLDAAIAFARKAGRLWPEAAEPLYWEGIGQLRAGRRAKARVALLAFLSHERSREGSLRRAAKATLREL